MLGIVDAEGVNPFPTGPFEGMSDRIGLVETNEEVFDLVKGRGETGLGGIGVKIDLHICIIEFWQRCVNCEL